MIEFRVEGDLRKNPETVLRRLVDEAVAEAAVDAERLVGRSGRGDGSARLAGW